MRNFSFNSAYYEWHLVDEEGNILHNMVEPLENLFNDDGNPLNLEEIVDLCASDLHCANTNYAENKPYNYVLLDNPLTEEEISEASKVMARRLYGYYIDNSINIKEYLNELFEKNELHYDYNITSDKTCDVTIYWGDWKHDHLCLDNIMRLWGFELTEEETLETDGSDAYSSIHTFEYMAYKKIEAGCKVLCKDGKFDFFEANVTNVLNLFGDEVDYAPYPKKENYSFRLDNGRVIYGYKIVNLLNLK